MHTPVPTVQLHVPNALFSPIADCECGYSVNATSYMLFTDLIETNWLHIKNASLDTDWQPQNFSVDPQDSHGPYGRAARVGNVVSNPLKDQYSSAGPSVLGGDAGLQLWVRSTLEGGDLVSTAEIDTMRNDLLYGSFRAAFKLTGIPGTCGAFFYVSLPRSGISHMFSLVMLHLSAEWESLQTYIDLSPSGFFQFLSDPCKPPPPCQVNCQDPVWVSLTVSEEVVVERVKERLIALVPTLPPISVITAPLS